MGTDAPLGKVIASNDELAQRLAVAYRVDSLYHIADELGKITMLVTSQSKKSCYICSM